MTGRRLTITARARSSAPRAVVWDLLMDGRTWPNWSLFSRFELEREGTTEPFGIGAIRVFSTSVSRARELVTQVEEGERLRYRLISGLPLRDYEAVVTLDAIADGTAITWSACFGPQPFGTGLFWRLFMRHVLSRMARDLAQAAVARVAGSGHAA